MRPRLRTVALALAFGVLAAPVALTHGAAAETANPALVGQWSVPTKAPIPPAHMALLPSGKVLMWVYGHMGTWTYIWNPQTNTFTKKLVKKANLMCPGFVQLGNGDVFVAGGESHGTSGIRDTHTFNWQTETWTKGKSMLSRRWYPTVSILSDGSALITGGGPEAPEVRGTDGKIRVLSTAKYKHRKRYPFMQVLEGGQVGYFGFEPNLRMLDTTGKGAWTVFANRDAISRVYGSYAMYDIGKVLVTGGGAPGKPPTNTAFVVEKTPAGLVAAPTASMVNARRQMHLTVLADGTVLATGGQASPRYEQVDLNYQVKAAELWNPATGTWTTLATANVTRQYHSTAILMPDGRLLTGGGGFCALCTTKFKYRADNLEYFSPPYLFAPDGSPAVRPVLTQAPTTVQPGGTYDVSVTSATGVSKMALVRLGADTHSQDSGQRYVPLTVTHVADDHYQATLPADYGILPPGYYMLFALNGEGVPAVAPMVQVV